MIDLAKKKYHTKPKLNGWVLRTRRDGRKGEYRQYRILYVNGRETKREVLNPRRKIKKPNHPDWGSEYEE